MLRLLKILRDIWILTDSGIVLFHRTYDQDLDEQLFGSLLSALNSFAEEISKGKKYAEFNLRHFNRRII